MNSAVTAAGGVASVGGGGILEHWKLKLDL